MVVQVFSLVPITPIEETKEASDQTRTYIVGAPALRFSQSKFKIDPEPLENPDRLTSYSLVYELDPELLLPPIITLDEVDDSWLEYVVQTTDYILYADKKYTVGMKVSVTGFEEVITTSETWKLEVDHIPESIFFIPIGEPPFYEESPVNRTIGYGHSLTMFLPTPQSSSEEEEIIYVEVEMGKARKFVKYNPINSSLKITKGMTSEDDIGEYLVRITLSTENGHENKYSFTLKVVDPASLF